MITQKQKTRWKEQTLTCLQVTELFDEEFRKKHPKLENSKKTIWSSGMWFHPRMVEARRKDKGLREIWINNLKSSPYLNDQTRDFANIFKYFV